MNIFSRYIKRIKFRRTITKDESRNVVDGVVKAHRLYRQLCLVAHPDLHPDKKEVAESLMARLVANKHDYEALLILKAEIEKEL